MERYRFNGFFYSEYYQGYLPANDVEPSDNIFNDDEDNAPWIGYGWQEPTVQEIVSKINEGTSILLYTGHADEISLSTSSFNVDDVEYISTENENSRYFLMSLVGCSSGSHDEPYMCLAEKLLVSEKGAIGVFSSTVLQS